LLDEIRSFGSPLMVFTGGDPLKRPDLFPPLLVIWETTQACDLACVHCRASARPERDFGELTTEEGYRLLDEIRSFGSPLMVFTGGDPLKRPDLFPLMRRSVELGLRTNVSPSATPLLTNDAIDEFKRLGLARMAISVDGATAKSHDDFRGIPGTFDRAMVALKYAQKIGLDTQQQTTVTRRNMHELRDIARIVEETGGRMWSLFFLVTMGRADSDDDLTAGQYEEVFEIIYDIAQKSSFEVKTTEAMHYRRFLAKKGKAPYRTAGVSDGKGFVFISHRGDIYPSGFLPVYGGNVRKDSLVHVYRNSHLFRQLRDPAWREGKCGDCEYVKLCGGSRARAYWTTGDYLAEDPRCVYQPQTRKTGRSPSVNDAEAALLRG
jgi:radical SAM protein with 4Fe4S-binding SPASM domain